MGWTSYSAKHYKNGKVDRVEEVREIWESGSQFKVLKSSLVGSVVYSAVERQDSEKPSVFASIFLTSIDSKSYYNFSFKDMDETCGPYYYDCPASILKLLTPTDSEYALEWRKRCWERIGEKREKRKSPTSLSNLPLGATIEMNYWEEEKPLIRLIKVKPYGYKRALWVDAESRSYKYSHKLIESQGYALVSEVSAQ